jgi:hypothetical protein
VAPEVLVTAMADVNSPLISSYNGRPAPGEADPEWKVKPSPLVSGYFRNGRWLAIKFSISIRQHTITYMPSLYRPLV